MLLFFVPLKFILEVILEFWSFWLLKTGTPVNLHLPGRSMSIVHILLPAPEAGEQLLPLRHQCVLGRSVLQNLQNGTRTEPEPFSELEARIGRVIESIKKEVKPSDRLC